MLSCLNGPAAEPVRLASQRFASEARGDADAARAPRAQRDLHAVEALTLAHRWPEARQRAAVVRAEADATGWPQLRAEAASRRGGGLVGIARTASPAIAPAPSAQRVRTVAERVWLAGTLGLVVAVGRRGDGRGAPAIEVDLARSRYGATRITSRGPGARDLAVRAGSAMLGTRHVLAACPGSTGTMATIGSRGR